MKLNRILQVLLVIVLPFTILMGSVRILLTPRFASFEYNRSWFMQDPFGMSKEERLKWSAYAINYLTNNEDIDYLGDLRFDDGEEVFNQRELEHMVDVKKVVKTSLTVWYSFLALLVAITLYLLFKREVKLLGKAMNTGAWITIVLVVAILVFLGISFSTLFERFHQIFFQEGSWIFYESDTLIRLFPIVFWRDAFILVCMMTLIFAALVLLAIALIRKRAR